jgi:arylsulfatase
VKARAGTLIDTPTSILDIFPTLIELAGIKHPTEVAGREIRGLCGRSLLPLFQGGGHRESPPLFQWYEFSKAWIEDEWKVVSLYGGPWQLFNLREDRTEANDLSGVHPDRAARLVKAWQDFATESNVPDASHPVSDVQHGWGWHRLTRICPSLKSLYPEGGSTVDSTTIQLRLAFGKSVDFSGTAGKHIVLYDVSDESSPIWRADPDESHPGQGKQTVVFDDIPVLIPDHHYAIRWDAGFVKIGKRSVGTLNDGAYWWRFRTPNRSDTPSTESK